MRPRVILHNVVSADGRFDHLTPDLGLFYELAATWQEDATLVGSETILAQEGELPEEGPEVFTVPETDPDDSQPLLAVVDSGGRVRKWHGLRTAGFWRGVVALSSRATPASHLEYLAERRVDGIIAGDDRVDLGAALATLNERYGVETVRVDAGGRLNGALLRAGLVDELSLLLAPCLVGGETPRGFFRAPDLASAEGVIALRLTSLAQVGDGYAWLRYEVIREKV